MKGRSELLQSLTKTYYKFIHQNSRTQVVVFSVLLASLSVLSWWMDNFPRLTDDTFKTFNLGLLSGVGIFTAVSFTAVFFLVQSIRSERNTAHWRMKDELRNLRKVLDKYTPKFPKLVAHVENIYSKMISLREDQVVAAKEYNSLSNELINYTRKQNKSEGGNIEWQNAVMDIAESLDNVQEAYSNRNMQNLYVLDIGISSSFLTRLVILLLASLFVLLLISSKGLGDKIPDLVNFPFAISQVYISVINILGLVSVATRTSARETAMFPKFFRQLHPQQRK